MNFQAEEHLYFELISSLWREREKEAFVSRRELHDELFQRIPTVEDELLTEFMRGGIDLALDAFAFFGYNEKAFSERLDRDAGVWPATDRLFWRYKVVRQGVVGYVRPDDLTDEDRDGIATRDQQSNEHPNEMRLETELLEPYFITSTTTGAEAWAALKARLEAGDKAEQARYAGFMLRGLKQRFLQ